MKRVIIGIAIGALTLATGTALARPGGSAGMMHTQPMQTQPMHSMGAQSMHTRSTAMPRAHAYGQPNASCGSASAPNTPGNAASAPGSAFNENGVAGTKYAGQQPQNSNNPAAVSQYDAACAHQPH